MDHRPTPSIVPFREALRVWVRVALLSFGGPAGQIAVMHRILVDEKRWVSERRFLHALNYCMLLPGPEAQQLATYVGWLLHGWRGGLVAGTLFILPGFLSIFALSVLYAGFQGVSWVEALFFGLKPAVMAVVAQAVVHMARRALGNSTKISLALAAFVAIHFLEVPFPIIILTAAGVGLLGGRLWPEHFTKTSSEEAGTEDLEAAGGSSVPHPGPLRTSGVVVTWLVLWWVPLIGLAWALGGDHVLTRVGLFFAQASVVTFGGAYAVLAYVAQQAVETFGWLEPGEMLDGLGMAETTPGPLIQVVQFVGFMAVFRHVDGLDPMLGGLLGSVVVSWVTFAPCFLFIFAGAPYIEALRGHRGLGAALSAITAAVVGVILNLAVWFSLHTLFGQIDEIHFGGLRLLVPKVSTLDPASAMLAILAFVALWRFRLGMIPTLFGSVALGMAWYLWGGV